MGPVEAVKRALEELGEATDAELAAFVRERFGVRVLPPFLPVIRATLRGKRLLARPGARPAADGAGAEGAAAAGGPAAAAG
jgi:hypothetical protein